MKQYMNAEQKQSMTMMLACAQFLEQAIEKGDRFIPTDVASDLKRGRSFTWRALDSWLKRMDHSAHRAIVNIIKDHEIGIITTREAREKRKEMDAMLSGKEYVERMAEITLQATCSTCDGGCRDTCPLYESYRHFEVPALDPEHPKCEYSMIEVTG